MTTLAFAIDGGTSKPCLKGHWLQRSWVTMGTYYRVRMHIPSGLQENKPIALVYQTAHHMDEIFSPYRPDSEISRLNNLAGSGPVQVSPEMIELVSMSLELYRKTRGTFNIAIAPLVMAWGFIQGPYRIPSDNQISHLLPLTNPNAVHVNRKENTISMERTGMALDFGGIAKGYTLDQTATKLRNIGIFHALLNLGGQVQAMGYEDACRRPWTIYVRHPKDPSRTYTSFKASNLAFATSGTEEKYFQVDSKKYSHLLDPRTGRPIELSSISLTVASTSGALADALATGLLIHYGSVDFVWIAKSLAQPILVLDGRSDSQVKVTSFFWPPASSNAPR